MENRNTQTCYLAVMDLDESQKSLYDMTRNIYSSPNLHDVVLCTKYGETIYSHKIILYSISAYFQKMFDAASKELETVYCVSIYF